MPSELGNWAFYKAVFGKTKLTESDLATLDTGESQPNLDGLTESFVFEKINFNDSLDQRYEATGLVEQGYCYHLTPETRYSPSITISGEQLKPFQGHWIQVKVKAYRFNPRPGTYENTRLVASFEDSGRQPFKWKRIRIENKLGLVHTMWAGDTEVWDTVSFFTRIPAMKDSDKLKVYVWNSPKTDLLIDDLEVVLWGECKSYNSLTNYLKPSIYYEKAIYSYHKFAILQPAS